MEEDRVVAMEWDVKCCLDRAGDIEGGEVDQSRTTCQGPLMVMAIIFLVKWLVDGVLSDERPESRWVWNRFQVQQRMLHSMIHSHTQHVQQVPSGSDSSLGN